MDVGVNDVLFTVTLPVTHVNEGMGYVLNTTTKEIIPLIINRNGTVSVYNGYTISKNNWLSCANLNFRMQLN